jgi:hypothetical protein
MVRKFALISLLKMFNSIGNTNIGGVSAAFFIINKIRYKNTGSFWLRITMEPVNYMGQSNGLYALLEDKIIKRII